MEKFGIFELLDALSAFASAEKTPEQPTTPARADASDSAFSPPVYGMGYDPARKNSGQPAQNAPSPVAPSASEPPADTQPVPPPAAPEKSDALSELLARHEALSKKIDRKE